jgi:mitochondrial fission protein ELM1
MNRAAARSAFAPLRAIRVLSDGRPGHENQSVGLALALARRTGATHEVVKLDPNTAVFARMRAAARAMPLGSDQGQDVGAPRPELIISAGHRTHLPLWWVARRLGARSVVIMKPSLPLACFDLALVPRHDVAAGAADTEKRVLTRGALNRVPEELPGKEPVGLVLVGGPSKHHGWDAAALAPMIARVIAARPDLEWIVADSRRTPEGFLNGLVTPTGPLVSTVPHQATGPGWLAGELARASVVWATEDSVSMVHEAATAGAATGVLPAPRIGGGRVLRAIDELVAAGFATRFPDEPTAPATRFHEAGRCADLIVARWFAAQKQP